MDSKIGTNRNKDRTNKASNRFKFQGFICHGIKIRRLLNQKHHELGLEIEVYSEKKQQRSE